MIQKRVDITVNAALRWWLIAVWLALVGAGVAATVVMRANMSTTFFVLAMGVSPASLVVILWDSAPRPTVAEILYAAHTKEGRP